MIRILIFLTAVSLPGLGMADVKVTILDGEGRNSIVSSDGERARIEEMGEPGFAVVDYGAGMMEFVDPDSNQVLVAKLGKGGAAVTDDGGVDVQLKSKGGGPVVAGYQTKKYAYTANGQSCGTIDASKKLFENPAIRGLFDSMREMQAQSRRMMQGMGGSFMDLCEQAGLFLSDALEQVGAPMRVIDQNGRILSQVTEVKTGVKFPAGHFQAPADMPRVNIEEQLRQSMQQTEELMQGTEMPDMNQILKQMEESGLEVPEDAKKKLGDLLKGFGE